MNFRIIALYIAALTLPSIAAIAQQSPADSNKMDKDSNKIGYWVEQAGNNKLKGYYEHNKRTGEWIRYHLNGKVHEKAIYGNGLMNGYDNCWDEYGNVQYERNYKNDTLNGLDKEYKGSLRSVIFYTMGIKDGIYKIYHDNSNLGEEATFSKGIRTGESKWYFADGKLSTIYMFKKGIPEGPFELFYENGNIQSKGNHKNQEIDGDYEEYYDNGNIKTQGYYSAGKKSGKWKEYNDTGTQMTITQYADDKEVGKPSDKKIKPEVTFPLRDTTKAKSAP